MELPRLSVGLAVAIGLGIGFGLYQMQVSGFDGDAYWNAALRLRGGEPLYQPGTPTDPLAYRYPAPFAWTWLPLSYLPHELVMAVWRAGMVAAALALIRVVPHTRWGVIGLWLFVPSLVAQGWMGNVQPLVILLACLGPVGIGMAGGIKALPLALSGLYAWRRQWRSIAIAVAVAAVLWAPTLLYDLSGYPAARPIWPTDLALLLAVITTSPAASRTSPRRDRLRSAT
jgi:hypothetical protein